jgi:hypothetical protein
MATCVLLLASSEAVMPTDHSVPLTLCTYSVSP